MVTEQEFKYRLGSFPWYHLLQGAHPVLHTPSGKALTPSRRKEEAGRKGEGGGGSLEREDSLWRSTFHALCNRAAAITTLFYGCLVSEMVRPERSLISSA